MSLIALYILILILTLCFIWWVKSKKKHSTTPQSQSSVLPKSKFLKMNDIKIHYVQKGSGPDVVLIHGLGASIYVWRHIIGPLSKNYKVTAIDLPGFGQSTKCANLKYGLDEQSQRLDQALKQLNITKSTLVGSSLGGALALWYAKCFPEKVTQIIAMAPATNKKLLLINPLSLLKLFNSLKKVIIRPEFIKFTTRLVYYKHKATEDDIKAIYENYKDQPEALSTFILATQLIADPRLPNELKSIQCPTSILWGNKDKLVASQFMHELLNIIPNSKLTELQNIGHHPMEECPEKCVHFLNQELNSLL